MDGALLVPVSVMRGTLACHVSLWWAIVKHSLVFQYQRASLHKSRLCMVDPHNKCRSITCFNYTRSRETCHLLFPMLTLANIGQSWKILSLLDSAVNLQQIISVIIYIHIYVWWEIWWRHTTWHQGRRVHAPLPAVSVASHHICLCTAMNEWWEILSGFCFRFTDESIDEGISKISWDLSKLWTLKAFFDSLCSVTQ